MNEGALPITSTLVSHKSNGMINGFLNNQYLINSNSLIIKNDLNRFRDETTSQFLATIVDALEPATLRADKATGAKPPIQAKKKLTLRERTQLLELHERFSGRRYQDVISTSQAMLGPEVGEALRVEILAIQARCYIKMGRRGSAKRVFGELEKIEPNRMSHKWNLAANSTEHVERVSALERALSLDPYSSITHFYLAQEYMRGPKKDLGQIGNDVPERILKHIDRSLTYDPSSANESWRLKLELLTEKPWKMDKSGISDAEKVLSKLEEQDPYSINFLSLWVELAFKKGTSREIILQRLQDAAARPLHEGEVAFPLSILRVLDHYKDGPAIREYLRDLDDRFGSDADYLSYKSSVLLSRFDDLDGAIDAMKRSLDDYWDQSRYRRLFMLLTYAQRLDEAAAVLQNFIGPESSDEKSRLCEARGDLEGALAITRDSLAQRPNHKNWSIYETYLLLLLKRYDECETVARRYLEHDKWGSVHLIVNLELARKLSGGKVKEERLSKFLHAATEAPEKAALSALLGDDQKCFEYLRQALDESKEFKYVADDWIVFRRLHGDSRYTKIFGQRTRPAAEPVELKILHGRDGD
jgi:tetratricopeptide (TPR) repeat protein